MERGTMTDKQIIRQNLNGKKVYWEEGRGTEDSDLSPQRNGRTARERERERERERRWSLSLKGAIATAYKVHSELTVRGPRAGQGAV